MIPQDLQMSPSNARGENLIYGTPHKPLNLNTKATSKTLYFLWGSSIQSNRKPKRQATITS